MNTIHAPSGSATNVASFFRDGRTAPIDNSGRSGGRLIRFRCLIERWGRRMASRRGYRRESWELAVAFVEKVLRGKGISVTRGPGHYPRLIASEGSRKVVIECHGEEGRGPRHWGARLAQRDADKKDLYGVWVILGEARRPLYSDILPVKEALKRLDKSRTWCVMGGDVGFRNRWDLLGFPSLGTKPS
jgi:hypothetical protein